MALVAWKQVVGEDVVEFEPMAAHHRLLFASGHGDQRCICTLRHLLYGTNVRIDMVEATPKQDVISFIHMCEFCGCADVRILMSGALMFSCECVRSNFLSSPLPFIDIHRHI